MASPELLTSLLRDVSRSFYQTLRVLPQAIRPQIGLAYLLARTTDTIADTELVPCGERLAALDHLRSRILGKSAPALDLGRFLPPSSPADTRAAGSAPPPADGRRSAAEAERVLLTRIEEALAVLAGFEAGDRRLIRQVLTTITSGQELDLRRFADARADRILALQTEAELDDYAYRVAGCVGEFWTKICRAHLFPDVRLDDGALIANSVRFGKGLQLVNILRDLPRDLRQGRCYVPETRLSAHGLSPTALLDADAMPRFRALFDDHLDLAESCLTDGWAYTNALPRGQMRVRLACAWPILIGLRTLARLRCGNVLDAEHRLKISRSEVKRLMLRSVLGYPWPGAWNRLFERTRTAPVRANTSP